MQHRVPYTRVTTVEPNKVSRPLNLFRPFEHLNQSPSCKLLLAHLNSGVIR